MPWPSAQDYNEAVQNPGFNFDDPELQTGKPELTPLGLPRPICGAFASVYKLQCGAKDWAVRCFLREVPDQQKRYAAISQHLKAARLPFMVGFDFLERGIRVRGQWYPVLKMEWVRGEPLNVYIENHLHDPAALRDLADRWLRMIQAMEQAKIAHGDLQHGNVLVANGALKLIDYDGMFVPGLAGQTSNEIGHRNYQHPQRGAADFGLYLDRFSAWVIYLSLSALSVEPALWTQLGAGEENLLFRQQDFAHPATSTAFAALTAQSNPRLRTLACGLQTALTQRLPDVPVFDTLLAPPPAPSRTASTTRPSRPKSASSPPASAPTAAPAPMPTPDWLRAAMVETQTSRTFQLPLKPIRLAACALLPCSLAFAWILHGAVLLILLRGLFLFAAILSALLFSRYQQEPAVRAKRALARQVALARQSLTAIERARQRSLKRLDALDTDADARRDALRDSQQAKTAQEKEALTAIHNSLQAARDALRDRRVAREQQQNEALAACQNRFAPRIQALNQEVQTLRQEKDERLARALEARQEQFLHDFLRRRSVWRAPLRGIGAGFKLRLRASGFVTAADIEPARLQAVRGIGGKRTRALEDWRDSLEAEARAAMPDTLPPLQIQRLTALLDYRLQRLQTRLDREQSRLAECETAARADFQADIQAFDAEQANVLKRAAQEMQTVQERAQAAQNDIARALDALDAETAAQRQNLQTEADRLQGDLPSSHRQFTDLSRRLETYDALTFRRYLRAFFSLRQPLP